MLGKNSKILNPNQLVIKTGQNNEFEILPQVGDNVFRTVQKMVFDEPI